MKGSERLWNWKACRQSFGCYHSTGRLLQSREMCVRIYGLILINFRAKSRL